MQARLKKTASGTDLPPNFRSAFLEGLTSPEIEAVLAAARKETISSHQLLQQQGESAASLWLLVSGRAAVYRVGHDGDQLFLRWGVPGDVFGMAMVLRKPAQYLVTVEAVQEGSLLAWDLAASRDLVLGCPNLRQALNSVVANYLEDLIDVMGAYAFQTAQQRIARLLIESAKQLGRIGSDGIELDLTNEQLAVVAHMSMFTTSRHLSKWQKLGILQKRRGKLVLPSLPVLEKIARGT